MSYEKFELGKENRAAHQFIKERKNFLDIKIISLDRSINKMEKEESLVEKLERMAEEGFSYKKYKEQKNNARFMQ